eukprot:6199509-Pleurochrysis_carterae.AAC.4
MSEHAETGFVPLHLRITRTLLQFYRVKDLTGYAARRCLRRDIHVPFIGGRRHRIWLCQGDFGKDTCIAR